MPTSTAFLLLQQKVGLLQDHMNWVIGGVTLTITFLMALFAVVQFVYQRRSAVNEIQKIKAELINEIEKNLAEKEGALKTLIKSEIGTTETELKKDISFMKADIARKFAIDTADIPATAFSWWLTAATEYSKNGSTELRNTSIKKAKESLDKCKTKSDVDSLLRQTRHISRDLDTLRENCRIEADLLEKKFKEKLESTPTED